MSSTTWTPRAVASSATPSRFDLWRAVEAQHVAATMPLVDTLAEQALLEEILEETKPPLPEGTAALDYLLATPFRYPPPRGGTRFRGDADPGVFYGAYEQRTACAELGYWRWRFLRDSDGLRTFGPVAHTLFLARVHATTVDLLGKPLSRDRKRWMHPTDYSATQALARACREGGVDAIRYESVRDPDAGACAAVLTPRALRKPGRPIERQTWYLVVRDQGVAWKREDRRFEFNWT